MLIVPLGAWIVLRMIPAPLLAEYRTQAARLAKKPVSRTAAAVILALWLAVFAAAVWLVSSAVR